MCKEFIISTGKFPEFWFIPSTIILHWLTSFFIVRAAIKRAEQLNNKNIHVKEDREFIKRYTVIFIAKAKVYCAVYKELEFIISGVNRTNVKVRIQMIIDEVINKLIPENMRARFSNVKKELEELLKASKLDASEIKKGILVAIKNKIYNDTLDEAKRIYKRVYFNVGEPYIKRAFTTGEIAKFLRGKDPVAKLEKFEKKLKKAGNIIDKLSKVIDKTNTAVKIFDVYSEGKELLHQHVNLKNSKDYKEYYYKVAQEASKLASELKSHSDKLPMGMRDYYEFIFTVAEGADKIFKASK